VLILIPYTTNVDKPLQAEFKRLEKMMRGKNNWSDIDTTNELPPNLRMIAANQSRTSRLGTVSAMADLLIQDGIAIALYQRFPSLLVLVGTDSCPAEPACLKRIASEQSMQFVIGISELSIRGGRQIQQAILRAQLYDAISDSVLLEGTYTGATEDHGPGTPCVEGTMRCALLNSTTELIEDFNRAIYTRIPGVREQYELAQRRYDYLQGQLAAGSDTALVGGLLPLDTSMLDRSALYFALANSDTSRFIGLFARPEEAGGHDEESVTVITDESDGDNPNMYTYTIAGVRHQGKWYYEKTNATSFYAGTLEDARNQYL
jgi:hypothetical protein